ncbi:hypothetical protein PGTUg99_025808 [Puccinia graminis f. sp. tritici]|uniref:Uncharacterized protein n=1 Tax=Puccinia graminis f. sp. tritici TaxID=56615 RepID=A0A5B0RE73_PUCGR|nr:hypothetical protein PGTUg99_025808 [Puccinia graminis f. sp. tritici]
MGKSNLFYRSNLEQATRRFLARNRGDNRPNNPRFDLDESDKQASLLGSSKNSSNRNQHSSFDALELFGQYLAEDNMIANWVLKEETDLVSGGSVIQSERSNWVNFLFIGQQTGGRTDRSDLEALSNRCGTFKFEQ